MKTTRHISLSTEGALNSAKDWVNNITVDGRVLSTVDEVKAFLQSELDQGHTLLPMADCPGHSYTNGCPGHTTFEPGDKVQIVNSAEAEDYKGCVFEVTSEQYELCGSQMVKMKCHETGKYFAGGYCTEFLVRAPEQDGA